MGILNLFKISKEETKQKDRIFKNIKELTAEERAWIEDLDKDGIKASEIAENLNLDIRTIYNYRRILNENQKKDPQPNVLDPIKQRQIIKDNLELQKLQLDCDKTIQTMQLDRLKFQKEIEEWKAEFTDPESNNDLSVEQVIDLIKSLPQSAPQTQSQIANPINNINTPHPHIADVKTSPEVEASAVENIPDVDIDDDTIRAMIKVYDKKDIKLAKLAPDQLIMDRISRENPTISEKSLNRAIEILRSEF